jgi:hypothetical protein
LPFNPTKKEKALRHSQSFCSVFFRLSPSSDEVSGKPFKDWQNTASERNTLRNNLTDTQVTCRLEWQGLTTKNIRQ